MFKHEIPNTPVHNSPPPLIEVSGTHREMGRQIGEAARHQVQNSVESAKKLLAEAYDELRLTWDQAKVQTHKYLLFSEDTYPQYLDEMRGIAEGANVTFEDIFSLNSMEGITMDALHLSKCTNFSVSGNRSQNNHVLVGHNEDWVPEDENDVFIINAKPTNEAPFLAMTYGGLLPNIGLNAYGISQCCNTVRANDSKIGIPRILVSRAVLSASNITDAIKYTIPPNRAAGYNHLIAHESGELYNIEVSANQFAILYGSSEYTLHTNHFLDDKMKAIDTSPTELIDTQIRYYRTIRLLLNRSQHTIETLEEIQKDHVNYPYSICNHTMDLLGNMHKKKTINAMIMDLTERKMYFAWGNPCKNKHHIFELSC